MKILVSSLCAFWALSGLASAGESPAASRPDGIAERGAKRMPFDLNRTVHVFRKIATGGLQQVRVKEAGDAEQIRRIREHLSELARRLAEGDFSGPEHIHGSGLPGLAELRAAAKHIRFIYQELPDGAQIGYFSDRPAHVAAIHRYFDAQRHDHAAGED